MAKQYVEAIIIKDGKVLLGYGNNTKNEPIHFFIRGEVQEGETPSEAINREIKEQINVSPNVIFKLNKVFFEGLNIFLVNIDDESKIDYSTKNIKKFINDLDVKELKWVSLLDKREFYRSDMNYFRILIEECMERDYSPQWLESLQQLVFSDPYSRGKNVQLLKRQSIKKKELVDSKINITEKITTMSFALILGIIYDYLFTGKSTGISYIIFQAIFIIFFLWTVRERGKIEKSFEWNILISAFLLSAAFGLHSNVILNAINFIIIPLLIVSYTILIRYKNTKWDDFSFLENIVDRISILTFINMSKPLKFTKEVIERRKKREINSTQKNIIKGLLISIPLLIVIVLLLTSADMVFHYYIRNIASGFNNFSIWKTIGHLIVIIFISLYLFGYVWSFKYKDNGIIVKTERKTMQWEPATILTIIFVINVVYLLFSIIQFSYLYVGIDTLPKGFNYAEYARKGFFQLTTVTVINFTIVLCSMKFMKKDNPVTNKIGNMFLSLLIIFTFNMLFSAHYKMSLYEKSYGLTYLRVFVHVFMLLLFILITIALIGVWNKKVPIAKASIVVTLIVYILLNYMNVDRLIARKNIERYHRTQNIDINYLTQLSYDATPELVKLINDENEEVVIKIKEYLNTENKRLKDYDSWCEFNFSKSKAKNMIESIQN